MKTTSSVYIAVLSVLMFSCADSSMYSTQMHQPTEHQWIDISPRVVAGDRSFRTKTRRSISISGPLSGTTKFVLDYATDHKQALIHWSGNGSRVIFILTRKRNETAKNMILESAWWRSTDYGRHFTLMADSFSKDATIKSYKSNTVDNRKMILFDGFNNSRRIWTTVDEGASYRSFNIPFSLHKIVYHPKNPDWILGYDLINRELFCSMNFGETWTRLGQEVTSDRFFWYVKGVDTGPNAEKIVHFEYSHYHWANVNRVFMFKSCYIPNCESAPFQRLSDALENIDEDSLVVQDNFVFVKKTGIAADKLFVSYKRRPFVKALFPLYSRVQTHFHVVSSNKGRVVIGINHENRVAHLFVAGEEGKKFRRSLSNVRYFNKTTSSNKKAFTLDIYEIEGVNGTFLANVRDSSGDESNKTKFSWDNGHSWYDKTTRIVDEYDGELHGCYGCTLNLHLIIELTPSGYYIPAIQAKKSHPGIIVAHGNFGPTLNERPSDAHLYISRDNGKSWKVGRRGRHLAKVINYGSTIVVVKLTFAARVREISFSKDYGSTWKVYQFTGKSVYPDGLVAELGESTHVITFLAHETYSDYWIVFQIDLGPLLPRTCSYPADFENVSFPAQAKTCNLGVIRKVERPSSGRECVIQPNFTLKASTTACNCTIKDYECDLGYKPLVSGDSVTCEEDRENPINNITSILYPVKIPDRRTECVNGQRNVSTGFRKIPGDQCQNDLPEIYQTLESCSEGNTQHDLLSEFLEDGFAEFFNSHD